MGKGSKNFSKFLRKLERKKIISRKPHPKIFFLLAGISLVLGFIVKNLDLVKRFSSALFFLAAFSFVFGILHLIVVTFLKNK